MIPPEKRKYFFEKCDIYSEEGVKFTKIMKKTLKLFKKTS